MGADLPPYIDEGANHLYRQRYHYDDTDDARRIAVFHPEKTAEVTYDREDVRHNTTLLLAQFTRGPALNHAVEVDE